MAGSVHLAGGAIRLKPVDPDDVLSDRTPVDAIVPGVLSGDASAELVIGDPGFAMNTDSGAADASGAHVNRRPPLGLSGGNAGAAAPIVGTAASASAVVVGNPSNAGVSETGFGSTPAAASGGLVINLIYDSTTIANAPPSFYVGMQTGVNLLEAAIQDNITINIQVGYGENNGTALPPGGNTSNANVGLDGVLENYSSLYTLLASHETSGADVVMVNDLPPGTTLNGNFGFGISSSEAKALGVLSPTSPVIDGYIGIGTNTTGGNLIAAALHEITHAMGRVPGASVLSLVRYFSPGIHDFTTGSTPAAPSYFSIDGGVTTLANFGVNSDPSDFLNPPASNLTPNSPFDENYGGSTLTSVDLAELSVLGFQVAPANFTVVSGQTISDTVINTGDNEFVQSGGVSVITYALSGGLEVISAGGVDSSAAINAGAGQDVFGGASGVFVYDGGLQVVESGGTASATTVSLGGSEIVSSGGTASATALRGSGGIVETLQDVQSGGTAVGTTLIGVLGGATFQVVEPGGAASATTIGSGTGEFVSSGGKATGITLRGGGTLTLFGGAIVSGFAWSAGTLALTAGFALSGQTVSAGQTFEILAGGSAVSTTIAGGLLEVSAGGTATGTTIIDGARETVASGASVQGEVISSGTLIVYSRGSALSTTIDGGGSEVVLFGGLSQFNTVNGGGSLTVSSGGLDNFDAINSGGRETLVGGHLQSASVSSGGSLTVNGGGAVADFTHIYGGGSETVLFNGLSQFNTIDSGASLTVFSGATGNDFISGSETASAGAIVGNAIIYSGGSLTASAGGIVNQGTIINGGGETVSLGGSASFDRINGGGEVSVLSGGHASDETIFGSLTVSPGGTAMTATIIDGGAETVLAGGTASAIAFVNGGTLALGPGAAVSGTVNGGNTAGATGISTLELLAGPSVGTLTGLGTQFINFARTMVDPGASWTLTSANTLVAGTTLTNAGTLTLANAILSDAGTVINNGSMIVDPSTLTLAALGGTGEVIIESGSTVITQGSVAAGETIAFSGSNNLLDLAVSAFSGTIADFASTDTIIANTTLLAQLDYTAGSTFVSVVQSGNTLNSLGTLAFDTAANAAAAFDSGSIISQLACFAAGTHILTDRGEVAVEHLRTGDIIRTVLGDAGAPIIWIGHRQVDCSRHPDPKQVWPVRVTVNAFGPGRPHHDLFISPDHAVFVNDMLIPIRHLMNGTTIAQRPVDTVTYFHIELSRHDVVLAQGLPAESYLDVGDRANFANGGGVGRLFPDFSARIWEACGCAPLIITGPAFDAARRLVNARSAMPDRDQSTGAVRVAHDSENAP